MPQYSTDATGVYYVRDYASDKGVMGVNGVLFDRSAAVSVAGWSDKVSKVSHFKTSDETTGKVTSKHTS